jgi:hypothetical protein
VAGRSYTTSELYFRWCERRFWSAAAAEEEIAARWRPGATTAAYVDPTAPDRAVAVRRIHPRLLLVLAIGLLLILVPTGE